MLPKVSIVFFSIFSLICFYQCNPAQPKGPVWEQKKYFFPTGEVSTIYWLKDGKQDSIMTTFDREGNKTGELRFRDDKQEGQTVYFYPSGKRKEEHFYTNGKKEGLVTVWYESGKKQVEANYLNDKKHGVFRKWAEDGSLILETTFAADTVVIPPQ